MKEKLNDTQLAIFLKTLDDALNSDIEDIKNFDASDAYRLEKDMLQNLRNLKKCDSKVLKISRNLDSMYQRKDKLIGHANTTKTNIIESLSYEIKKSFAVIIVYSLISSNNFPEFIEKVTVLLIINYLMFNANLSYFTSDTRKKIIKNKLEKLKLSITSEELNYTLYQKIDTCFNIKLDTQYAKLLELYPEIDEKNIKTKTKRR